MNTEFTRLSKQVGQILKDKGFTIATAESCTGGLLAHVLTFISGSSNYFIGGVVAYNNQVKESALGVPSDLLRTYGAVSAQTAYQMAEGIRTKFQTTIGLSTTGIAGPTGGTPEKPVGLVWLGISMPDKTNTYQCFFNGGREVVQYQSVQAILSKLLFLLEST